MHISNLVWLQAFVLTHCCSYQVNIRLWLPHSFCTISLQLTDGWSTEPPHTQAWALTSLPPPFCLLPREDSYLGWRGQGLPDKIEKTLVLLWRHLTPTLRGGSSSPQQEHHLQGCMVVPLHRCWTSSMYLEATMASVIRATSTACVPVRWSGGSWGRGSPKMAP